MTRLQHWVCQWCDKDCYRKPVRGQRPKYCSDECGIACRYEASKKKTQTLRYACAGCGATFTPGDYRDKYCSVRCFAGNRPSWTRRRRAEAALEKAAQGSSGGKRVWTSGKCPWCTKAFTSAGAKFCSMECRKSERRSRDPLSGVIPRAVRQSVYARDEWICQICMTPVRPEYDGTNWCATLDHIEPQSHALIPDHSEGNLRTVHLWCNASRGDRSDVDDSVVAAAALAKREMEPGLLTL